MLHYCFVHLLLSGLSSYASCSIYAIDTGQHGLDCLGSQFKSAARQHMLGNSQHVSFMSNLTCYMHQYGQMNVTELQVSSEISGWALANRLIKKGK